MAEEQFKREIYKNKGDIKTITGLKGAAWVGYKWVEHGRSITCSQPIGSSTLFHEAQVNNGDIEVRIRLVPGGSDTLSYDSGWVKKRYVPYGSYSTTLFEEKNDFVGKQGDFIGCTRDWL